MASTPTHVTYRVASGAPVVIGAPGSLPPAPPPPPPPPQPAALVLAADDTGTVGVAGGATVQNTGGQSASWSLSATPAGLTPTPASGTTAPGATTNISLAYANAATFSLQLTSAASVSGSPQSIVVSDPPGPPPPPPPPPAPSTITLSGNDSTAPNVPLVLTYALDQPATAAVTITPTIPGGGVGVPPTPTIPIGQQQVTQSVTWGSVGGPHQVDYTVSPTLTRNGRPKAVTVADFAWVYASLAEVPYLAGQVTVLANGLPADHTAWMSPGPLPGVTIGTSGTQVIATCDNNVPSTAGAAAGTPEAAANSRVQRVTVLPNGHLATLVNATKGITYSASSNNWNTMMAAADHGDTIEISPGYIHATQADMSNYFSNSLQGALLAVWKAVNLKGMAGSGRWRLYASDDIQNDTGRNASGIVVYAPVDMGVRASITIEDFEFDNWAQSAAACGIRVLQNIADTSSWNDYHQSITLRNFEIGKRPFFRSASGIAGTAQNWIIENGHVFDTGGGIAAGDGQDHNLYISGQNLTMRGMRVNRTRGNNAIGWWEPGGANTDMDGHHAKLDFNTATIEGCVFDCGPRGDSSIQIQMKGGGNLIVRGCLLIGGERSQSGTGNIVYEREYKTDGVTPNYIVWAHGAAGHSVLLERNLFISHYPNTPYQRAFLYFRPNVHPHYVPGVSSVIVRDNIGMNTVSDSALWIVNDPTAGAAWLARGNTQRVYTATEAAFRSKELLAYLDVLGAPAASQGSQAIPRFVWPHGFESVTRSTQGLG